MAICLNNLKSEIKTLESLFSKSHEVFQIVNASVDELTCRFISKNGKKYDIHANITVSVESIFDFFSSFLSLNVSSKKNGSMDLLRFVCVKKEKIKLRSPTDEQMRVDDLLGKFCDIKWGTSDSEKTSNFSLVVIKPE